MRGLAPAESMGMALACILTGAVWTTGPGLAAESADQTRAKELNIRIEDGLVSAEMIDVSLVEALKELARQVGFELSIEGEIDRQVNLSRVAVEVTELLEELLQSCSWFSVFGQTNAERRTQLSQVSVLQSPGCGGGVGTADTKAGSEPAMRARPAPDLFSTIDKDDLAQRQHHLGRVINGQARASVEELLEAVRDPRDPSIKILALMTLGRTGGPEAKAALVEALSDENSAVRKLAARSLRQGWGEAAVAPLNSLLSRETEIQVVQTAVQQLGLIGTDAAWDGLHRAADSENPRVSAAAQQAIKFFEELKESSTQAR